MCNISKKKKKIDVIHSRGTSFLNVDVTNMFLETHMY